MVHLAHRRFFWPSGLGRGVLVLVLWRARGAGRCLRELWGAVRALLRALGRSAALNLSSAVTQLPGLFQPQLRVRSVTALARVLLEACFEHTRRALARVAGYNRRGSQSRAAAQKQDNLIGPASIWLTRSIVPPVPPVVAARTRPQRHRPGQIPGVGPRSSRDDAARVQLTPSPPARTGMRAPLRR